MRAIVAAKARRDLFVLLATSRTQFGAAAQQRYRLLLEQAITDLAADPQRPGVAKPDGIQSDIQLYHSRHSRQRTPAAHRVSRPRHVLVFRVRGSDVEILRILHDAMDLPSHMAGL